MKKQKKVVAFIFITIFSFIFLFFYSKNIDLKINGIEGAGYIIDIKTVEVPVKSRIRQVDPEETSKIVKIRFKFYAKGKVYYGNYQTTPLELVLRSISINSSVRIKYSKMRPWNYYVIGFKNE